MEDTLIILLAFFLSGIILIPIGFILSVLLYCVLLLIATIIDWIMDKIKGKVNRMTYEGEE